MIDYRQPHPEDVPPLPVENLLLRPDQIEFQFVRTDFGTWKRHLNSAGSYFAEFTSHRRIFGLPLVHFVRGRDPQTGRRKVAIGVVAIGRIAIGIVPIGQLAIGVFAIGQLALGLFLGLGQAATGVVAVGQFALGLAVGVGQFATGFISIGQFGFGYYVLAQLGKGKYVWSMRSKNAVAKRFFKHLFFW